MKAIEAGYPWGQADVGDVNILDNHDVWMKVGKENWVQLETRTPNVYGVTMRQDLETFRSQVGQVMMEVVKLRNELEGLRHEINTFKDSASIPRSTPTQYRKIEL